jgi:hypothetical protein
MSTPLTDSINALTTYANEVTGASDTTLSDAVHTLASGYGGGSAKVVLGTYTPTEDVGVSTVQIPHNLGVIPEFVCCYADGISSDASNPNAYLVSGLVSKINATSPQTVTDSVMMHIKTRPNYDQIQVNFSYQSQTKFFGESWVKLPFYNTGDKLKAGVTYHYAFGLYS